MAVMFEVFYRSPATIPREEELTEAVESFGGRFDFREPADQPEGSIVLTYEFDDWASAERAAKFVRDKGVHVEGPTQYGD